MPTEVYPLQVLLLTLSGFVNRRQADVIAYLVEENRILKEQITGKRLRLRSHALFGSLALKPRVPMSARRP